MRQKRKQRVRRCPHCGDRHTRAEGCVDDGYDEDDPHELGNELYPEDEAFGLGAFIGSLMAGLSALAERQRRRQQPRFPIPNDRDALPDMVTGPRLRRCHFCQRTFTNPDDLQRYRSRAWDGSRLICADCVMAVECEPEVIDVEYEVIPNEPTEK